jgi:flagellum-specific peptidoglycan hydrolase FlgJ
MTKISTLILFLLFFVSCTTNKSVIQTTKKGSKSNSTEVVNSNRKPAVKGSVENSSTPKPDKNYSPNTQILEATSRVKVTNDMILEYIDTYKDVAQSNMKKYGIPASIILGQAILESGSGTGALSSQANNHFGIKCHKDWLGESVKYDDDSIAECFRKYDKAADSFRDHALFLTGRPRYASLFNLEKTDYKAWAKGLKAAGYATDVQYPTKLIGIIERFQLYKYDDVAIDKKERTVINDTQIPRVTERYVVTKGDTLYSISKKYNIPIEELKRQNNIFDNAISIGQSILIQK